MAHDVWSEGCACDGFNKVESEGSGVPSRDQLGCVAGFTTPSPKTIILKHTQGEFQITCLVSYVTIITGHLHIWFLKSDALKDINIQ